MDSKVESAFHASLNKFAESAQKDATPLEGALTAVFNQEGNFLEKVEAFDAAFDEYPAFEELREVLFDLLMINFFASDMKLLNEDYLDSEEWAGIEEQTIERGTELLNLLLYINECHDEEIKPELGDFLKEFLLVEEDEFQDEFHIYEDLISNQQLADSSIEDICSHAGMADLGDEIRELFVPFMAFFYSPKFDEAVVTDLKEYSNNTDFDVAVYSLIAKFNEQK